MSHEFELPHELNQWEAELTARKLPTAAVDRESIIYQAGFTAGRNSFTQIVTCSERPDSHSAIALTSQRRWQRLSLAMASLSIVLSLMIVRYEFFINAQQPMTAGEFADREVGPIAPTHTDAESNVQPSGDGWLADQAVGPDQAVGQYAGAIPSQPNQETDRDKVRDKTEPVTPRRPVIIAPTWLDLFFPESFASTPIKSSPAIHRAILARDFDPADYLSPNQNQTNFRNVTFGDRDESPQIESTNLRDLLDDLLDDLFEGA